MTDHSLPEDTEGMPDPCAHHTHEHVGWRKWAPLIGYIILVIGIGVSQYQIVRVANHNKELITQNAALINRVANDCVDRDGDVSYRQVLEGLIKINRSSKIPSNQRRVKTAAVLEKGLSRAGKTPSCILPSP